tara:strand:- start:260 stop:1081 length:822 start_codon:yes stop_codon:yes gene_type:complete
MARNTVLLSQIIGDFLLTQEDGDFSSNSSHVVVQNVALRGIREMGFDLGQKIKSLKLEINSSNNTVELPDDFVDLVKLGAVGGDGMVYVFPQNKNINYSSSYVNALGAKVGTASSAADSDSDGVFNRADSKTATDDLNSSASLSFRNFAYADHTGALYGLGGGHKGGTYRLNLDQNRIEIDTTTDSGEVVIEYIADEARSSNPSIHVYVEEALRSYMYYKLIERKASVPMSEKARARTEYYNERRKATARLSNFTKEEALQVIQKNFKQSPKI